MPDEPSPPTPSPERCSKREFPPYRFMPGKAPHPRRHPQGHSYGKPEVPPPRFDPKDWKSNDEYLYGIDLFNYAFWWDCHESLEGLWHLTGHKGREALYLQGIIQVAAANIQRFLEKRDGARRLANEGMKKLIEVHQKEFMGLHIGLFLRQVHDYHVDEDRAEPPLIELRF